jgi:hypothetical protein
MGAPGQLGIPSGLPAFPGEGNSLLTALARFVKLGEKLKRL